MILERTLLAVAAAAAIAAAAVVGVVALAFALYAVLEAPFGRAGAAAAVAGVLALFIALVGLIIALKASGKKKAVHKADHALTERLIEIVKDRPILSAAAAVAAGVLAMKNPALVSVIVGAFLNGKAGEKK